MATRIEARTNYGPQTALTAAPRSGLRGAVMGGAHARRRHGAPVTRGERVLE